MLVVEPCGGDDRVEASGCFWHERPQLADTLHDERTWVCLCRGSRCFYRSRSNRPRELCVRIEFLKPPLLGVYISHLLQPLPLSSAIYSPHMATTPSSKGKGRARPEDLEDTEVAPTATRAASVSAASDASSDSDSSDDSSDSDSSASGSDSDSDSEDDVTPEFLESLLAQARRNAAKAAAEQAASGNNEEEFIELGSDEEGENKKQP